MNQLGKKIAILFFIFIAAVAVYFVWNQEPVQKNDMVYTAMDEATLPVVYTTMYGREMNLLHGYTRDMKQAVSRESLTILPEDRALPIRIADYPAGIKSISYEVRSLDLKRLVERTSIDEWTSENGSIYVKLPIQNLLAREQEYLLVLSVETPVQGIVTYYTRIMWTENEHVSEMIDFALDFTTKTFDYDQARELTTYLETSDSADNTSLGNVTIKSSFSQLTWAGLGMELAGDIQVTLKDLSGVMCNIQLKYQVAHTGSDGVKELYETEDNFTVKWDSRRIYLMDFNRTTNQIFSGQRELFSGQRILLGITNDDNISTRKSPDGNIVAYVVNRDLWTYNQGEERAMKVFSFRSGVDDGLRSSYDQHDIKILSVADNGDTDFLVYGYMNRGLHEGTVGIALYQYRIETNTIEERFFAPVDLSFEMLKADVSRLAHLGSNGMLYMMADHAVYGIDLNSNEYMVLADSLTEGSFAVSGSERRFAWQEGTDPYGAQVLHLMDLDTGNKKEITGNDAVYRPLGFVGDDFVYGMSKKDHLWVQNGRVSDKPMYRIEIMDDVGRIVKRYEYEDLFIADVTVEESRIHLTQIAGTGGESYVVSRQDTIVCNEELKEENLEGIGWYASEERRKLYFVQLDQEVKSREVRVSVPKKAAYEMAEVIELKSNTRMQDRVFYAYAGGHYLGSRRSFTDAVNLAYERMGVVTDDNQEILWARVDRPAARNIKDPRTAGALLIRHLDEFTESREYDDGIYLLDARGCTLNQVLYFIGRGCPVAAYTSQGSYLLLSGYDQYNVTIYHPDTGESQKMGLNDAAAYFANMGNDFICGVFTE